MPDRGPQPTLPGRRLRLRPWRADDAPAVHATCQDPELQRWTEVPVPYLPEHAEQFVGPVAADTWAQGGASFAVETSASSHPFWTGNQRVLDTAGRVEKFNQRYGARNRTR